MLSTVVNAFKPALRKLLLLLLEQITSQQCSGKKKNLNFNSVGCIQKEVMKGDSGLPEKKDSSRNERGQIGVG